MIFMRLDRNSEPQASIETGNYIIQYVPEPKLAKETRAHVLFDRV